MLPSLGMAEGNSMEDNWSNEEIPPVMALSGPDCLALSEIFIRQWDIVEEHPLSLTDKVTFTRLNKPCRGLYCKHFQCFDYDVYMVRNADKSPAEYSCPVCDLTTNPTKVFIDMLWVSLLQHFSDSTSDVVLYADASCGLKPRHSSNQRKIREVYDVNSEEFVILSNTCNSSSNPAATTQTALSSLLLSPEQLNKLGYTTYTTLSQMLSSDVLDVLYIVNRDDHNVSFQPITKKHSFDFHHFRPFVCQSLSSLLHDIASKLSLPANRSLVKAKGILDDLLVLTTDYIHKKAGEQVSALRKQQRGGEEEKRKKKKRKRERRESELKAPAHSSSN
ncbi:hypothetical protein EON64_18175, partial [archaeon]